MQAPTINQSKPVMKENHEQEKHDLGMQAHAIKQVNPVR